MYAMYAPVQIEASSEGKSVNLEVKHFHFTVWPDHGVPKYATAILTFHKRVCKHHQRKRGSPLLVHCRYKQILIFVLHNCMHMAIFNDVVLEWDGLAPSLLLILSYGASNRKES